MELTYLMVKMSPELKRKIESVADSNGMTQSRLVRAAMAVVTGYDLSKDDYSMGPSSRGGGTENRDRKLIQKMVQEVEQRERERAYEGLRNYRDRKRESSKREISEAEQYLKESMSDE